MTRRITRTPARAKPARITLVPTVQGEPRAA
jgi:hypothetical protein